MTIILSGCIGIVIGLGIAYLCRVFKTKTAAALAEEMFRGSEQQRATETAALVERFNALFQAMFDATKQSFGTALDSQRESFSAVSLDVLASAQQQFLSLASERLGNERQAATAELDGARLLIDQRLGGIYDALNSKLTEATGLMRSLESDRQRALGQVGESVTGVSERITQLSQLTGSLREALSSTKTRGIWGERIVTDLLSLAGLIEGVSYERQVTLVEGTRPDFTFLLPRGLRLNMDSKFPMSAYLRMLDAQDEVTRAREQKQFLSDVRLRLKEVTGKEYIDAANGTCDVVLLFIPNESLYGHIHQMDSALIDEALKKNVIMCSPFSLFAVLAVIRAAVDQFALERTSNEILSWFGQFFKQWSMFTDELERHGKQLNTVVSSFESLSGPRRRMLERPLTKINDARQSRGIEVAEFSEELSA